MDYLIEIKDVPESKPLMAYLRTLKYVKIKDESKPKRRKVTDEEMALPFGKKPSDQELEEWLIRPDKDKGTSAEIVKKRLIKKLRKQFPSKK